MTSTVTSWQAENQHHLAIALERLRSMLQRYVTQMQSKTEASDEIGKLGEFQAPVSPPAFKRLCSIFHLSLFEQDVLLLCAGVELSASLANLCAAAQGGSSFTYATFSLALAALPNPHWSALSPERPLRYWRLIEVSNGESLTQSRLRIDERILHYLNGVSYLDDRLSGLMEFVTGDVELPPSHQVLAQQIVKAWSNDTLLPGVVIQLCGEATEATEAIALAACKSHTLQLYRLRSTDIPTASAEREALARLWQREALLTDSALLVECSEADNSNLQSLFSKIQTYLIISSRETLALTHRPTLRLDVQPPTMVEERALWQQALGRQASRVNGSLDRLISQFRLSPAVIQQVCQVATSEAESSNWDVIPTAIEQKESPPLESLLWNTCRAQARPRLDNLAQRIMPLATWPDLILPEAAKQTLWEIAAQVRQRVTVYDRWEFAARGTNGLGISALFAGDSGTGKTMAAEVLAQELQLDLYRIDLSAVVSKYIGETEKNLRRVFDAAETGGVILLFDEADALFGKRSEVRDSHDRYANIEVSYLLQRMEAYRGLAILTTNFKNAIDSAFMRRLRFVVQFPFPDAEYREQIWQRVFPSKLPTRDLDFIQLARLNVSGGNIRNIALNAAFLAADQQQPVGMYHLLKAAQSEYAKLEKTLTEAEVGGW